MNNLRSYAVYDKKAIMYDVPFFAKSDLFAKRKFIMDVQQRQRSSMLSSFKDDFELHFVGEFNPDTGLYVNTDPSITIIAGKEITTDALNNEA